VFPAEPPITAIGRRRGPGDHTVPPTVEELKYLARASGLGNLFLPSIPGLSNLE
jgi:hypothetical protein